MNAHPLRRTRTSLALAAALVLAGPLACAAEAGLHDTPKAEQQSDKRCVATTNAVLTTRDGSTVLGRVGVSHAGPDWLGSGDSRLSPHAYTVLHSDGAADMDGLTGACRLDNADVDTESRLNDGTDVVKLLQDIDDWLELNRRLRVEKEEADFDQGERKVSFELGDDKRLHVYIGDGGGKTDLGRFQGQDWEVLDVEGGGRLPALFGVRRAGGIEGGALDQRSFMSSMAPVPEPATYLMLLAGLAVLAGVAKRRRQQ